MWCKTCNIETNDTTCPICGAVTVEDIPTEIYWCSHCQTPIIQEENQADKGICPLCGQPTKYMAKDLRPVFPEERLLIEILLNKEPHQHVEDSVWAADSRYYINGKAISLSSKLFQDADADSISLLLNTHKPNNSYVFFDKHIETFIKANSARLHYIKDEANDFIHRAAEGFDEEHIVLSFSGGKDSTATADVVIKSLGNPSLVHIFGNTTLEFPLTYEYADRYREDHPLAIFKTAKNREQNFHDVCEDIGPPARMMRWCCSMFKTGPITRVINGLYRNQQTDPDQNVTLVIGDNGTGKTTFAQAFTWCLYGETDFSNKTMLNRIVAETMTPDQKATVKVVLALTHGDADYEIIRTQEYKKSYSNKVTGANTVLNISRKNKNGNTKYLKPNECEFEIKKIIPKELAGYFFFDGERIEKMSKEIATGKKSSNFANAVQNLTGLNATLSALDHLSPSRKTSVYGKFNEAYKGDSDGKMQQLTKEIDALQAEIDKLTARQSEIEDELSAARASKAKFEQDIKQYADGEKLQNERDNLNKQLANARNLRAQLVKQICKSYNNKMTNFFTLSVVQRALEVVSHSDFSGKDIPEMHAKTIEFLLNRGTCICGTHLDPGTIPYNKVKALLEYLPPQSIGVTVGQFVKDSQSRFLQDADMYESISEQLSTISQQDDHISDIEDQIATISAQLDGDDVREQVKKLNAQIKSCDAIISAREREQKTITFNLGAKATEKSHKENSRSELSLLDKNNRKIEIYKAYTERIYLEMYAEYKAKEKQIREDLENLINEIFKTIYNGGLSLTIDDHYNISVYVTDYEGDVETSTAQSIAVIFAFISAIIKMARENQRLNGDETYSEPYPLVMDAPLSAFDKRRIRAICSAIPETAEQVIIFIKDTDGELAEEHLGTKVKTRHYFEKINEFETRLS